MQALANLMLSMPAMPCPCGSGRSFDTCCAPLLSGTRKAASAEALMRSRYTAFALKNEPYLLASWHSTTRPASLDLDAEPVPKWIGLQVKRHVDGGDGTAIVEFVARYRVGGRAHKLHETSRFRVEDDAWRYVDGTLHEG